MPQNAEFSLILVEDPYQFASASQLSLFRRSLPATNLAFLSTVMWDGRENVFVDPNATPKVLDLQTALGNQANDATLGHAQAAMALGTDPRQAIVAFETALFTAQATSLRRATSRPAEPTADRRRFRRSRSSSESTIRWDRIRRRRPSATASSRCSTRGPA
jgi:hypothetical protein